METVVKPLPKLPRTHWKVAGEAHIYEMPGDASTLIKVYHDGNKGTPTPKTGEAAAILLDLIELGKGVSPSQSWRISTNFAWPQEIYGTSLDRIQGVSLLKASDDFEIEYSNVARDFKEPQNLVYLGDTLSRPIITKTPYTSMPFESRIEIAFELMLNMRVVWEMGFRYCDYSENNILWAYQPYPRVFILDLEGCRRPGVHGNRSNGWFPRPELGYSIEADRSQCALAVWRIIAADMNVGPPDKPADSPANNLSQQTVRLIEQLWTYGEESTFIQLLNDLRSYRAKKFVERSFEEAISTQFARVVLEYAPLNPTPQQRDILARAQEQFDLEQEVLSLEPRLQRLRLNRILPVQGFEFDIASASVALPPQQDAETIRELALRAEFEYIAELFANLDDCMPINTVATRSAQVALANCPNPDITMTQQHSNLQRYEWGWPGAAFVNSARIRIIGPDNSVLVEKISRRNQNLGNVSLRTDVDIPHGSKIEVCYGLRTSRGEHVFSPFGATANIVAAPRFSPLSPSGLQSKLELVDRPEVRIPSRPASNAPKVGPASWTQPTTQPPPTNTQIGITMPPPPPPQQGGFGASVKKVFSRIFRR